MKKSPNRNDVLDRSTDNFNMNNAVILKRNENGELDFIEEPLINGTVDDYKTQNLLDIGAKYNALPIFRDSEKLMLKSKIENMAKKALETIENKK